MLRLFGRKFSHAPGLVEKDQISNRKKFRLIQPANATIDMIKREGLGIQKRKRFSFTKYHTDYTKKIQTNKGIKKIIVGPSPGKVKALLNSMDKPGKSDFLKRCKFVAAATRLTSFWKGKLPEICFAGRSNVGKSHLINALTRQAQAKVKDHPGYTKSINWYDIGGKVMLVDLPGYGFAFAKHDVTESWQALMKLYLTGKYTNLKRICLLIDARHGLKLSDKEFLTYLKIHHANSRKLLLVMTKCDLVPSEELAKRYQQVESLLRNEGFEFLVHRVMMVSSFNGAGMQSLRKELHVIANATALSAESTPPATGSLNDIVSSTANTNIRNSVTQVSTVQPRFKNKSTSSLNTENEKIFSTKNAMKDTVVQSLQREHLVKNIYTKNRVLGRSQNKETLMKNQMKHGIVRSPKKGTWKLQQQPSK